MALAGAEEGEERLPKGERVEMGLGAEEDDATAAVDAKLRQVPRLRCSEAVRDGFEAEKTALHSEQRSLTAFGSPASEPWTSNGSRLAQYHAPFPFSAFARTATSASYRLLTTLADASAASPDCFVPGEFSPAIHELAQLHRLLTGI